MKRRRSGPPKSASSNTEKAPIEAKVAMFGFFRTLSANANSPGMTTAARIERFATASHLGRDRPHAPGRRGVHAPRRGMDAVHAPRRGMDAVHTTCRLASKPGSIGHRTGVRRTVVAISWRFLPRLFARYIAASA